MRKCLLSMLSCAALLIACQPVTPLSLKTETSSPNLKGSDVSPIPPTSMAPPTPPVPSVPTQSLSSGPLYQNNNQTEIDLSINTVTKSSETQMIPAQASPNITPKPSAIQKTFDPMKIIGVKKQTLFQKLGSANMVRKEGPIEVWQYQFVSCVVDFFFYPIGEESSKLVLKIWDMRSTIIGGGLDRGNCLNEMNLYHQKFLPNSEIAR